MKIDNTKQGSPLIYGEFEKDYVGVATCDNNNLESAPVVTCEKCESLGGPIIILGNICFTCLARDVKEIKAFVDSFDLRKM